MFAKYMPAITHVQPQMAEYSSLSVDTIIRVVGNEHLERMYQIKETTHQIITTPTSDVSPVRTPGMILSDSSPYPLSTAHGGGVYDHFSLS